MQKRVMLAMGMLLAAGGMARAGVFNEVGTFGTGNLALPSGIAVDDQGATYVTDMSAGAIRVFDAAHTYTHSLTGISTPLSIAAASNGMLYVGNMTGVTPLSKEGVTGAAITTGTSIGIYQVSADTASNIFVTDPFSNSILEYSSGGSLIRSLTTANGLDLHSPHGVTVNGAHIYVADSWNDRIVIYDLMGNYESAFAARPTGWDHPGNIAVSEGILFVAVPHTGFAAWSMEGQLLDTYTTGISSPTGIVAVGGMVYGVDAGTHTVHLFAVPEPATLGILGVALAGLLGRARRQRSAR